MTDYHAQGQQDYVDGNGYNQPYNVIDNLIALSSDTMREQMEANEEYAAGWEHAQSQAK
ncbi:MAG: hypothetical protein HOO19_20395 [Rhodospirillaceae bacterium]|jgi:Cdc6-like AAA superfamily ATPase|nr:hypothetical protein [Rhodospirillaceae bacterium]MBT3884741.1 hypothetical protein [Rhodospirillaceae bacterium]MBT4117513.1 hypothetical protein [Rhodospirillaceae bacterium]MBT4670655.1 hypothetical protein [Rhodospirillaceae bacterium]MBT4720454.1 hypothetical protein [Rhodospirillaceae bacterium]